MAVDIIARGMAASGVKVGSDGKIPADLLPSYVDDITDLIAVDSAAPAQCSEGDKYYNTTDKLIYTATGTNTWGSTGETPEDGKIYLNISANPATSYRWSGTDLVEVGQDLSNYITLDSAQTVTGVKTFSNLPESSATPTTNNQLVNKKYVDDNAGGYSDMFSTDVNSFNNDETTRAKVAEFITKNKGNMVFFCIAASPATSYNSPTSGAAIFKMYVNGIFSSANYHGVKITGSPYGESYQSGSVLDVGGLEIKGTWSNDVFTLTSASVYTTDTVDCYLSTSRNVNFTPTAAGHPTTKKYVDDNISENTWLLTDNAGLFNKLYVTSSSALSTDVPQTTVEYLGSGVYTLSYTYTTDQVVTPATRYILHLVKSTTGSIWTQDVYCDIYIKRNNTNVLTTKTETFKLNGVSSPETYTSVDFKFDLNITEPFSIQSGDVFQIQIHTQGGQFGGSLYSSSVNPTYISQCTNGINAQYVYDTIDGVTYSQHDINAMIGNINTILATLTTPNNGGGN